MPYTIEDLNEMDGGSSWSEPIYFNVKSSKPRQSTYYWNLEDENGQSFMLASQGYSRQTAYIQLTYLLTEMGYDPAQMRIRYGHQIFS